MPVNLTHPDQVAEADATIGDMRGEGHKESYDIVVALPSGTDPQPFAKAGATWWLTEFKPESVTVDLVRGVIREAPRQPDLPLTKDPSPRSTSARSVQHRPNWGSVTWTFPRSSAVAGVPQTDRLPVAVLSGRWAQVSLQLLVVDGAGGGRGGGAGNGCGIKGGGEGVPVER